MLNKNIVPSENDIKEHIGKKSFENMELIKKGLEGKFKINTELKFPFGNNYGWGYKFNNGKKHLFYLFFEKESITIMLQIKGIKTEKEMENLNELSEEGKNYWQNRYPCRNNGGCIHYRIINKKADKGH